MIGKTKFWFRGRRYGRKDRAEIQYIRRLDLRGKTAIDIGAHKGAYLYWLMKQVGRDGNVFAFEPQPRLADYLKRTLSGNRTPALTIEGMGLSSQSGSLCLNIPRGRKGSSPSASFEPKVVTDIDHDTETIPVSTLDEYWSGRGAGTPAFIKCDVEGHELRVFEGGSKLLQKYRPKVLVESEARHLESGDVTELFRFFAEFDYAGYFFHNNTLAPVETFSTAVHQPTGAGKYWEADQYCNNFVFEPRSAVS